MLVQINTKRDSTDKDKLTTFDKMVEMPIILNLYLKQSHGFWQILH